MPEIATTGQGSCCGKPAGVSVAVRAATGCCGNCQQNNRPAETLVAKTNEECGQNCNACAEGSPENCKCESDAQPVSTGAQKACCGKCQQNNTPAETLVAKTNEKCGQNCNACAEGSPEKCKCDDAQATATVSTTRVNTMREDRDVFHFLLGQYENISREVTELENGVRTVTESTDPQVVGKIQEHVASMHLRIKEGRPLRMWDDLFREIFQHADKIDMQIEKTPNGISVTETSDDPYVAKLIKSHAKVVTGFTERGFAEARENHQVPAK